MQDANIFNIYIEGDKLDECSDGYKNYYYSIFKLFTVQFGCTQKSDYFDSINKMVVFLV